MRESLSGSVSPYHRLYGVPGFLSSRPNWVPLPHPQESVALPLWVQGGKHTGGGGGGVGGGPIADQGPAPVVPEK